MEVGTYGLPTELRKRAMNMVDSSGGSITIGYVLSKGVMKLSEAQKVLLVLAADIDGY